MSFVALNIGSSQCHSWLNTAVMRSVSVVKTSTLENRFRMSLVVCQVASRKGLNAV